MILSHANLYMALRDEPNKFPESEYIPSEIFQIMASIFTSCLSFLAFVLLVFVSYFQLFPCFSANCLKDYIPEVKFMLSVTFCYLIICSIYLLYASRAGVSNKLTKTIHPVFWVRVSFPTLCNYIPRTSYLDVLNFIIILLLLGIHFGVMYYAKSVGNVSSKVLEWHWINESSGHMCDLLLALNFLPVSRRSFITCFLNLNPITAIRYHQLMGNLLLIALTFHTLSYFKYALLSEPDHFFSYILRKMFFIGYKASDLVWKTFRIPSGVFAGILILLIRIFSLPNFRRSNYNVFLISHFILPIPIIALCAVHSTSTFYFTLPAIGLYILDLIYRLVCYLTPYSNANAYSDGSFIRLDVTNPKNMPIHHGSYYNITIPLICCNFSHPFSGKFIINLSSCY
jgi:hypothetical protein